LIFYCKYVQWSWLDTDDSRDVAEQKQKILYQNLGNNDCYYDLRKGRVIDGISELQYELQPCVEGRPFAQGAREPQEFYHNVITGERITRKNMCGLFEEYDYSPSDAGDKLDKDWLMIGGEFAAAVVPIVFGLGWLLVRMRRKGRKEKRELGPKFVIPSAVGRLHAKTGR
jgi:hypothetical protein